MAEFDAPDDSPNLGMGSNDLQQHIDALTAKIQDLTTAIQGLSSPTGTTTTSSALPSGAGGAKITSGSMVSGPNGGGAVFSGQSSGGMNSGAAGGNGASGGLLGAAMGGSTTGSMIAGGINAAIGTGASQYANQVMANSFSNQMSVLYGGSPQNWQTATFGKYNQVQNANALSWQDAAQGQAINQYTGRGANVASAANAIAFANPGIGAAQSASVSNALYNNQTAMNLRMYSGVNVYSANGQANSMTNVLQQIGQRYGGALGYNQASGTFNIATLRKQMNTQQSAFGQQFAAMTGMNQSQLYDIVAAQSQMQTVAAKGHVSMATVQNYLNQASGAQGTGAEKSAQSWLYGNGWTKTDQQAIQNAASSKMAQQSGESNAFNSALQSSADLLNDFNNAVNSVMGAFNGLAGAITGYKNGLGAGASLWAGQNPNSASILSSVGGNAMGMLGGNVLTRMLSPYLAKIPGIGGVLGGAGTTAATGTTAAAGGTVAAGAGDAALAGGGAASAGGMSLLGPAGLGLLMAADVFRKLGPGSGAHLAGGNNYSNSPASISASSGFLSQLWNSFSHMGQPLGFASGGVVPGYSPGVDNRTVSVSGGEGILTPEATRALGGSTFVNTVNKRYAGYRGGGSGPGGRHFANGGIAMIGFGGDSGLGLTTDADSMLFDMMGGAASGLAGPTLTGNSAPGSGNGGSGSGGSAGGGPAANATAGSGMQNARTIYNYLLRSLFGGNKIAAAGAVASIWGESSWNPEASEGNYPGAGKGLIQWSGSSQSANLGYTPLTGNATRDMNSQLPGIIKFVRNSGAMGAVSQMLRAKTVLDAANLWGTGVEHYGVDDVHSTGVSLAGQIAGLGKAQIGMASGGTFIAGERGPEAVTISNGQSASVMTARQTASLLRGTSAMPGQGPWTSSATAMYVLDALSPANAVHGQGGGGVTVNLGGITIQGGGMASSQFSGTGTGSDINVIEQQLEQAVERAVAKSGLLDAVRQGNTG